MVHLGVNLDKRKYQKYRVLKAKAAWEMVKRLTRLRQIEKAQIVVGQILPTLLYGAELFDTPLGTRGGVLEVDSEMDQESINILRSGQARGGDRNREFRNPDAGQEGTVGGVGSWEGGRRKYCGKS